MKVAIFARGDKRVALVSYEKYGTLSIYLKNDNKAIMSFL